MNLGGGQHGGVGKPTRYAAYRSFEFACVVLLYKRWTVLVSEGSLAFGPARYPRKIVFAGMRRRVDYMSSGGSRGSSLQ